ncbi:Homeodomain-like protein [Choiromyces venosus 120613-1]|uniref:Homeodomain-like protein n=1 Tax=Choiromyces venosus 120613-1 TaxID=1336337 RepID=A0A3N4JR57_9PEZI|nr:Homeodomain-like protein [Choiromyces venosus 120613-1]
MQQHKNSKRRELSDEERVSVILLYKEGKTYRKIGEEIRTSRTTVGRIVQRYEETGHVLRMPRKSARGRNPALSKHSKQLLVRTSDKRPRASLAEIVEETHLHIHPKTAGRYLRQENHYVHLCLCKPWLDHNSRKRCKRWCRERKHWSHEWRKMVYTDEMKLQVGAAVGER